ncbi:LytR C-terminal domain-containing protein [Nocardioides coralli]|uniref:LytR C-terminal domain-containing protein n=1 Tax=Nocardioides coralli TaxID=2872154 RepID=UPI0020170037|nr:LytR C-terminal domain-containing protein [Nocardioides coralli]
MTVRPPKSRSQRGVAFPSPVAILSIIAVAMAGVAFVATQGQEPTEREVTPVAQPDAGKASPTPTQQLPSAKPEKIRPQVVRGDVYVEVYNNSGITGLAGRYAGTATEVGWQVVGSDNWYGTVTASTVYYPARLEAAGKLLALDLGIKRVVPAIDSMRLDRLTVVLTGDAA